MRGSSTVEKPPHCPNGREALRLASPILAAHFRAGPVGSESSTVEKSTLDLAAMFQLLAPSADDPSTVEASTRALHFDSTVVLVSAG